MYLNDVPLLQAIQQQSFYPFIKPFTAGNRRNTLKNVTQNVLPQMAMGMTAKGGLRAITPQNVAWSKATPYFKLSPSVESSLRSYAKARPGYNPTFKYKNGWGHFNNTRPENMRAMAADFLSKFK